MNWICLTFSQLSTEQLYELLKLRVDIFVVEQTCPYPELDNKDRTEGTYHLLGYRHGKMVAYSRLLSPGISYSNVSFGRVAIDKSSRGTGLGQELISTYQTLSKKIYQHSNF